MEQENKRELDLGSLDEMEMEVDYPIMTPCVVEKMLGTIFQTNLELMEELLAETVHSPTNVICMGCKNLIKCINTNKYAHREFLEIIDGKVEFIDKTDYS